MSSRLLLLVALLFAVAYGAVAQNSTVQYGCRSAAGWSAPGMIVNPPSLCAAATGQTGCCGLDPQVPPVNPPPSTCFQNTKCAGLLQQHVFCGVSCAPFWDNAEVKFSVCSNQLAYIFAVCRDSQYMGPAGTCQPFSRVFDATAFLDSIMVNGSSRINVVTDNSFCYDRSIDQNDVILSPNFVTRSALPITFNVSAPNLMIGDNFYVVPGEQEGCLGIHPNATSFVADTQGSFSFNFMAYKFGLHSLCRRVAVLLNDTTFYEWQPTGQYIFVQLNKLSFTPDAFFTTAEPQYIRIFGAFFGDLFKMTSAPSCAGEMDGGVQLFNDAFTYTPQTAGTFRVCVQPAGATQTYIGLGSVEVSNVISFYPTVFDRKKMEKQTVNILGSGTKDQFVVARDCKNVKNNDVNIVDAFGRSPLAVSFPANTQGELQVCRRSSPTKPFVSIGKIFVSLEVILEPEQVFASFDIRTFEVYGLEINDVLMFVPSGFDCNKLSQPNPANKFTPIPGQVVDTYLLVASFPEIGNYDACLQACDYPDTNGQGNCYFKESSASISVVERVVSAITIQPTNVIRSLNPIAFEVTGAEFGDVFALQKVVTCDEIPFPSEYLPETNTFEHSPFAIGEYYLCVQSFGADSYTPVSDEPMVTVFNPSDRITPAEVIGNTGVIQLYPESVDSSSEFIGIQNNTDCSFEFGGFAELDVSWFDNAPANFFTIDSSTYLPGVYSVCLWDPLRNALNLQTTFEVRAALALSPRRVSRSLSPRNFTITNAREGDKFKFDISNSCDGDFQVYDVMQDMDTSASSSPFYITHIPENPLTTMLCVYNDKINNWIFTGLTISIPYIVSPPGAQRATELTYTVNQLLPGDQFLIADPNVDCGSTNRNQIRPITVNTTTNQFNYTTFLASGDLALCVKSAISTKYFPYTYITVSSGMSYMDRFYRQYDIQTLYIVGAFRDDTFHLRTMTNKLVDRGRFNDIKIDLKHSARYQLYVSNPRFLDGMEVYVSPIHVFIDLDPAFASVEEHPNIKVHGMLDADNLYSLVPERFSCPDPANPQDTDNYINVNQADNSFDYLFENKDVGWLSLCVRDSENSAFYKANLERGLIAYPLCPRDQWGSDCYSNGVCNNGTCACYAPARGEGCNKTTCDLSLDFPQNPLFTPNKVLTKPWLPATWSLTLDGDYFLSIKTYDASECLPEIIFAWTITDYLNNTYVDPDTGLAVQNYIVATYTDNIYVDPFIFKPDYEHNTVLDAEFFIPASDIDYDLTFYAQKTVIIKTALPDLWTEIGGGDRLVSLEESLYLDGSLSLDLADPFCLGREAECIYKWTCTTEAGADCTHYINDPEEEVTIVDSALGTGNFTFGLYFQKNWLGKERNYTAQNVTMEIVNGTQPLVFVERYRDDFRAYKVSVVSDNYMIAYVDIADAINYLPYSYSWSCDYFNQTTQAWTFFGPTKNDKTGEYEDSRFTPLPSLLIINGFTLKSDVQYRCRLDVQCTDPLYSEIRGHGNVYFTTVPPPYGGTCNVTVPTNPDNTTEIPAAIGNQDTVQLVCGDWKASQGGNPIKYYAYINKDGAGPFDDVIYLNLDDGLNKRFKFTMPPVEKNGTLYNINVNIIDKRGGLTTVSKPLTGLKPAPKVKKSANGKTTNPYVVQIRDSLYADVNKAYRARKVDDLLLAAAGLAFFIDFNIDPSAVEADDMVYVNEVKVNTTQFMVNLMNVTRNAVQIEQAATIMQKFASRDAPIALISLTTSFVARLLNNGRAPVNDRSARNVIKSLGSSSDNANAAAQRANILRSMGLYKEAANAPDPREVTYQNTQQVVKVLFKTKMSSPNTPVNVDNGNMFVAGYTTSFNKTAQTGNGSLVMLPENIAAFSNNPTTRGNELHTVEVRSQIFSNPTRDETFDNSQTRQTSATSDYNLVANNRGEKAASSFTAPSSSPVQICMPITDNAGFGTGADQVQEVLYYNTTTGQWSNFGIVYIGVVTRNGKPCLAFNTTHFSFFGSFVSFLKPRTSPAHSLTLFSGSFFFVALATVLAFFFVHARRD